VRAGAPAAGAAPCAGGRAPLRRELATCPLESSDGGAGDALPGQLDRIVGEEDVNAIGERQLADLRDRA
jgi:hypothetical protein